MNLRPFTNFDWTAFCGAESFKNGDDPLSAEIMIDGLLALAVLDATGLQIHWVVEGDPWCARALGAEAARVILALHGTDTTTARQLISLGMDVSSC